MDPQQQFKERYNSYVEQRNSQVGSAASNPPPSPKKYSPNKFYVLGIIVGLMIIAPVASYLFLANRVSSPSSKVASNDQASITNPTEQQIDAEMQQIWGPYYEQNKDNAKARERAKQILIRKNLVKQGIAENKVSMSSVASVGPVEEQQRQEKALEQAVLSSRNVDYAFVFLDPSNPNYETNKLQVEYSYNLIKKYLDQGKTMQEAYDIAETDPKFFKYITITNDRLLYKDDLDKRLSTQLFQYKKGQNTDILDSSGGTFVLAHVNESTDTPYATLDQWIKAQENK